MPTWKGIIGRGFRAQKFKDYVATLTFSDWRPQFAVVHNTSAPRLSQWHSHPGAVRMRNLESYYRDKQRWAAGPHLFIADDLIWVFTPLTTSGTHSPSWNSVAWGIEMVGEFDIEPFSAGVRDNTVAALAALHSCRGLDPATIRFHKEDPATTHKDCPGKNVKKADLIARVRALMDGGNTGEHSLADDYLELGGKVMNLVDPRPVIAGGAAVGAYLLKSALLAADSALAEVAATDLVLVRPRESRRVPGIATIQRALNQVAGRLGLPRIALGPGERNAGFFGEQTEKAIRAFQRSARIGVDGKVGDDTLRALDLALAGGAGGPLPDLTPFPLGLKLPEVVVAELANLPADLGAAVAAFTRPPATSRTKDGRGGSKTSGLKGSIHRPNPALEVVVAAETLEAKRDNAAVGQPREVTQRRIIDVTKGTTIVEQSGYCWGDRKLPNAVLFTEHPGFEAGVEVIKGEASYFGKYDPTDEGTGTPVFGKVQTNSSVFGISMPQPLLIALGLATKVGKYLRPTEKGQSAMVEVYYPKTRRLVRVPLVDVGPQPRLKRPADLSVAACAFLQDKAEETARGYKLDNIDVVMRVI